MKITRWLYALIILIVLSQGIAYAQNVGDAYVIPIHGEINKANYQYVKENIDTIKEGNFSTVIFDIDTYGGYIVEAEKIKELILSVDVPTITFVNKKAESAGVLLTIAGDRIAMANGATIGSAEPIPNNPKTLSMWVEQLRATAKLKGRDDRLIASMADKEIYINDVVEKGKLLNLNYEDAKRLGLADVIADSYSEILDNFEDIKYNKIVVSDITIKNKVAQVVSNPLFAALLLAIGFIGMIIEVFTPGFGAGGTLSVLAFGFFFWASIMAGNSGYAAIIMFVVGIILLIIELMIPGFGIPGVGGLASIVISIILASRDIQQAVISLVMAFIISIIFAVIFIKYGQRSPYFDKLVLSKKQGVKYTSTESKEDLLGKEGIVLTALRPAGTIKIEDKRIDAVSDGQFIKKGAKVKIIKIEGRRVVVEVIK